MNMRFEPSGPLRGRVTVPADKSISHRAAIIGAMASEPVRVRNYLDAADTNSTLAAVQQLGAIVEQRNGELVIRGCGLRNAMAPGEPIDVGNAGTLMRLLPGWLCFQQGSSFELDGDDSIRRRPVDRIAEPLSQMGARIEAREGRFPPFTVHGAPLTGIDYELPVASGQVKSCVLLAGLVTDATTVVEPVPTRDHTERMLAAAGAPVAREQDRSGDGFRTTVGNTDELELGDVDVPGDHVLGRVPARRRRARAGLAAGARACRRQLDPRGLPADPRADGRDRARAISNRRARSSRSSRWRTSTSGTPRSRRPRSRPRRCRSRSTSCRWWRCSAASPTGTRSCAAPTSCGSRNRTGSRPSSKACAASAPRSRRSPTGSS